MQIINREYEDYEMELRSYVIVIMIIKLVSSNAKNTLENSFIYTLVTNVIIYY